MDDLHARGHLDRDIPGFDQEFEDMEDELEEDFEEERSLNTDDFDEHADDMEDLEDLTPEEVEDREAILDDREGRLAGPIVRCGRWTNRVVELDGNTTAKFESTKITNRRGDKFLIKVDDSKPRVFCEHDKPTSYYPAYSFQRMKVWFSAAVDSKFPNSGATCKIKCAEVL